MEEKDLHIEGLEKKKILFSPPIGYFDKVEDELMQKLFVPEKEEKKVSKIWYALSAAAVIALFVFIMTPEKSDPTLEIAAKIDTDQYQYLHSVLLDENSEWALNEEEAIHQLISFQEDMEKETIVNWMIDEEWTEEDILQEI